MSRFTTFAAAAALAFGLAAATPAQATNDYNISMSNTAGKTNRPDCQKAGGKWTKVGNKWKCLPGRKEMKRKKSR